MPFVQISLVRGKSLDHIAALSESVHQALMEEFNVPALDRFQVVHEVEPHRLVFPPNYLGVPHTKDIVYIHITCKEGRTVAMKRSLYRKMASLIASRTGLSDNDVVIVLIENAAENWSFGRGETQLAEET